MTDTDHVQKRKAEALLLTVVCIWSSNFPIAKWAIGGLGVYYFNSIRHIVAFVLLAAIFFSRTSWTPVARGDRLRVVGLGLLSSVLYQMVFIIGLSMTTAGNSAVLLSTAPLWTVFLSAVIYKEQIRAWMWVGTAVSLCGVVLIIIGSGKKLEFGSDALYGDVLTLVSAILWGLNTNLQKPLLTRYSPLQLTLMLAAIGAIGLSLLSVPSLMSTGFVTLHPYYFLAAFISGGLSIALANVFWSSGVKKLGPSQTANFANLVPVLAFVISYVVLDEHILPVQIFGAATTVTGVWIARR